MKKQEDLWLNQINDRPGHSRNWKAVVRLTTNEVRHLENSTASTYEEAVKQFQMWTNFKEFIQEPYITY